MRNISAWAIRHPVTPIVLFVVLFFLGVVAFIRLPINLNPDISFPLVNVNISQPGAAPTEMETQIAQKVEGSISSIGNVRNITTFIVEGQVNIFLQFEIGTPIDRAVTDVRDAVAKVRNDLPQGIFEPQVTRQNVDGGAFAYYAVTTTNMTPEQLSWFIDNTITKRLLALPGVAQVSRSGGVDREIRVELDPEPAAGAGADRGGGQSANQGPEHGCGGRPRPGGRRRAGHSRARRREDGGGAGRYPDHTAGRQIRAPGRNRRRARRHRGGAHPRAAQRPPGDDLRRVQGHGRLGCRAWPGRCKAELDKIKAENPSVQMTNIFTTVDHTLRTYHSAISALIEGSILAVVVVWFFLRNVRATLIAALAIPLSAIPTFAFMQWMGFTLNQITLLGLSLVAGVLVDDAIVEIENIVRHMRMGKSCFRAAMDAADEIGLAVVATSFTIIAVFLPVSFMGGISGQFFKQFGLTVAAAVFISLMVARLITPVLAAYALRSDSLPTHNVDGPIMTRYLALLRWCVANRWKTICAGAAFFLLSVACLADHPDLVHSARGFFQLGAGYRTASGRQAGGYGASLGGCRRHPEKIPRSDQYRRVRRQRRRRDPSGAISTSSLVPRSQRSMSQRQWEQKMMPLLSPGARRATELFSERRRARHSVVLDRRQSAIWSKPPATRCLRRCVRCPRCATRASRAICRVPRSWCTRGWTSPRSWA